MVVTLTYSEMLLAIQVAGQIQVQNLMQNRKPRYGAPKDFGTAAGLAVMGAIGEMAVAKAMNVFWMGNVGNHGTTDVGGDYGVDVRTRTNINHNLILHPKDEDNKVFVAVCFSEPPKAEIVGWCYGHEGKVPEYWQEFTGRPCYFVPNKALHNIEELIGG